MSTNDPAAVAAETICRRFYGYYNGGSAGSASALAYYDKTGRHLPGPASLIEFATEIIREAHRPLLEQMRDALTSVQIVLPGSRYNQKLNDALSAINAAMNTRPPAKPDSST